MIFGKPLKNVTATDIQDLVANTVPEGRHLDYKKELPGRKDSDKKRFLADVAALANSAGGDILYGIKDEHDGGKSDSDPLERILGIQLDNADETLRRLTSIIDSGLDPSLLPKPEFRLIQTEQGDILVLRVARSFTGPHMVREQGRFYVRQGSQNLPMDTATLRASFTMSQGWAEKVRHFRDRRLAQILANDLPTQMDGPERLVIHLVPFSAFEPTGPQLNISALAQAPPAPLDIGNGGGGLVSRFNMDGLCLAIDHDNWNWSYVQFFRDGCVEAAIKAGSGDRVWLFPLEDYILRAVDKYAPTIVDQGAATPIAVLVSLVGAKGRSARAHEHQVKEPRPIDREVVTAPDLLLENCHIDLDAQRQLLRPLLDAVWQGCGYERSASYDEEGRWQRKK